MAGDDVQVIRGGRVLDTAQRAAVPADLLLVGDTIRELGPPGLAAPADARLVDATDRILIPGAQPEEVFERVLARLGYI